MTPLWTSQDAVLATSGKTRAKWQATGVSIDTRTIVPGDLFVALTDVRDGHEFVAQALEKGAAAAMVSRVPDGVSDAAPLLIVENVLAGLEGLARNARARSTARFIAVTGSVGKTSTKEMLKVVLNRQGQVHAAEASYNNHWGVPLTLARLPASADFAVIEIGMSHPGEIAPLSKLTRPHVAMITTIAPAHMEAFDGIEGIAAEKASVFEGLEPNGACVFYADLEKTILNVIERAASATGADIWRFGTTGAAQYRLIDSRIAGDVMSVKAALPEGDVVFRLNSTGQHFADNALGVLAVCGAVDADIALAARDMMDWLPPAGRGMHEIITLDPVDVEMTMVLIDDAFNANPTSMAAALQVLAASTPKDGVGKIRTGRRIAVLGDMLELGENAAKDHAGIVQDPAIAAVDVVYCCGPLMRNLWDSLPDHQRGEQADTPEDLAAMAHQIVDAGDVILVKGSKGSRVSLVVDAIRKLGHPVLQDNKGS